MAIFYKIFGAADWVARLPVALASIALALLSASFGMWAFGTQAGFYAGLCLSTCVGLFLFTRIQIPDVMLTFTIALALWAFLRALDEEERRPRLWAAILAASLAPGFAQESGWHGVSDRGGAAVPWAYQATVFPQNLAAAAAHERLVIVLIIAAPWHVLATVRNAPYFAWTLQSGPGQYHGFLWFYFVNEQVCCGFSTSGIRMTTIPFHGCTSGCCTFYGSFPGACICPRS